MPGADPAEQWRAMAREHREQWLWHEEHPHEDAGAGTAEWEAEQRRMAEQADPETEEAFEHLHSLAAMLDATAELFGRYVAFGRPEARTACALWAVHCHVVQAFDSTPRLVLVSPEKQSGKTRTLEVLELITPCPRHGVNLSAAALFRAVAAEQPTLLFDEADTFFGAKAREHEELRGLVNAGHRKGAMAYRCVGDPKRMEVHAFPAYCAVALAAIGDLPDTITDRAVVIRMRRRSPDEVLSPFRRRLAMGEADPVRADLEAWAGDAEDELAGAWPSMPPGLTDRAADVWMPLLAIADMAGGGWPERARAAATVLDGDRAAVDVSLGVRLLADLRDLFSATGAEHLPTKEILEHLNDMDDAPWGDIRGKPTDARGLARRLRKYGAASVTIRHGDGTAKGYRREDLHDAFTRYLPPKPQASDVDGAGEALPGPTGNGAGVPLVTDVPLLRGSEGDAPAFLPVEGVTSDTSDTHGTRPSTEEDQAVARVLETFPGAEIVEPGQ